MADNKRNFVLREEQDGEVVEDSEFTGRAPRQAAVKAARRVAEVRDSEDEARENAVEISLRERGTDTVHSYEAWAWTRPVTDEDPDVLQDYDELREANVSKLGLEHLDD